MKNILIIFIVLMIASFNVYSVVSNSDVNKLVEQEAARRLNAVLDIVVDGFFSVDVEDIKVENRTNDSYPRVNIEPFFKIENDSKNELKTEILDKLAPVYRNGKRLLDDHAYNECIEYVNSDDDSVSDIVKVDFECINKKDAESGSIDSESWTAYGDLVRKDVVVEFFQPVAVDGNGSVFPNKLSYRAAVEYDYYTDDGEGASVEKRYAVIQDTTLLPPPMLPLLSCEVEITDPHVYNADTKTVGFSFKVKGGGLISDIESVCMTDVDLLACQQGGPGTPAHCPPSTYCKIVNEKFNLQAVSIADDQVYEEIYSATAEVSLPEVCGGGAVVNLPADELKFCPDGHDSDCPTDYYCVRQKDGELVGKYICQKTSGKEDLVVCSGTAENLCTDGGRCGPHGFCEELCSGDDNKCSNNGVCGGDGFCRLQCVGDSECGTGGKCGTDTYCRVKCDGDATKCGAGGSCNSDGYCDVVTPHIQAMEVGRAVRKFFASILSVAVRAGNADAVEGEEADPELPQQQSNINPFDDGEDNNGAYYTLKRDGIRPFPSKVSLVVKLKGVLPDQIVNCEVKSIISNKLPDPEPNTKSPSEDADVALFKHHDECICKKEFGNDIFGAEAELGWTNTAEVILGSPNNVTICLDRRTTEALDGGVAGYPVWGLIGGSGCTAIRCGTRNEIGCFDTGTELVLGDGQSVSRVEDIKVGDYLLNPVTQKSMKVTKIIWGPEKSGLFLIEMGMRSIKVSQTHPFATARGLLQAQELVAGDRILGENGRYHDIMSVRRFEPVEGQLVWNFEFDTDSDLPEDHFLLSKEGIVSGDITLQGMLEKR